MGTRTKYTQYIKRSALGLIALHVLMPLMMFGATAARVEPAAGAGTTLVGRYMLKVGELSSMLPISSQEIKADDVTLEQVLLATENIKVGAIPTKLFLDQNYPNPFNPSTMIRYGLPAPSDVKLTIHSLLGNQVKVVLDGTYDAGVYIFDFAAEDLPSGIYFYRLQTTMGTLTRRMTISK